MAKAQATAVAKRPTNNQLAVPDYGDHWNQGFENQTRADITIPFLKVLQDLSPEIKKKNPEYIEGAEPGMLLNTVTRELINGDDGLLFVPAITHHCFVEWIPRSSGGGFVGVHEIESDVVREARRDEAGKLKYGENDLVETFYVYGVQCDGNEPGELLVLAFTSTKISVYKRWNTRLSMFTLHSNGRKLRPPMFAHLTKVGSVTQKNNHGEFYNFSLEAANGDLVNSLLPVDDPRLLAAMECKQMVESGAARAAHESLGTNADDNDAAEPPVVDRKKARGSDRPHF